MKTLRMFFFASILFSACSVSKESRSFTKQVSGTWQLKSIVTEGMTGQAKADIFHETDFNCFIGSTWIFNNNNLGTYSIPRTSENCNALTRNIRWSFYEAKDQPRLFQFKRLDNNMKEIDASSGGYRFTIIHNTDSTLRLRSDVTVENKNSFFTYNFIRI